MLDDYQKQQSVVYQIMKNAVKNQKISHAYLFDIKNSSIGNEMVLSFVKYLLCPYYKSNLEECGSCTQCKRIDDFNYPELKIIHPDGLWIKKEQMDELQEEFSKKAIEGRYKIYVIDQVEKLNKSAANSLLKFLEEPEEGIIAILITNNLFQVLETIRSRCQILSFTNEKGINYNGQDMVDLLKLYVHSNIYNGDTEQENEKYKNFVDSVVQFIEFLEKKGKETILYTENLWHKKITEKEEFLLAFDVMTFFYSDILKFKCDRPMRVFFEKESLISSIANQNSIDQIVRKIDILMNLKQKIKINMNNNLLIDKLILSFIGGK